jgi:chromosomal replication initiation ATPase DnaA
VQQFLPISIKANRFAAASVEDVLKVLSHHAIKYRHEYEKIPVLIIDNANKLAPKQQELLDLFQDYAKRAADEGIVTIVFVSSEGRVPRRMMGKLIMFIVYHVLIKYYREILVVKTWAGHRNS